MVALAAMDFAIAPLQARGAGGTSRRPWPADAAASDDGWEVLVLRRARGVETVARLASFGHRAHAEAFLADFLAQVQT